MEGRRRKLCAAMEHSNQCCFNNCDQIDGACGKTKRIIRASLVLLLMGYILHTVLGMGMEIGESPYQGQGDIGQY